MRPGSVCLGSWRVFLCALAACVCVPCMSPRAMAAGGDDADGAAAIPPGFHVSPGNTRAPGEGGFAIVSDIDGMELVLVPGGEFLYGEDRIACDLPSFYIDRHEVTNDQFSQFVAATGYAPRRWHYVEGRGRHPAVNVSLLDAEAYAAWAGRAIPTEGQWEKAARGTDGRPYPWGDEWHDTHAITPEFGVKGDVPVGSAPQGASPYGAMDMVGNVWEWTVSPYREGSDADGRRALRGGAWDAHKGKRRANCTYRSKFPPERADGKLGFRCVWPAQPWASPIAREERG